VSHPLLDASLACTARHTHPSKSLNIFKLQKAPPHFGIQEVMGLGQTNVRLDKCQVGQMSVQTNVRSDKCEVGQMSGQTNVRSDKCQVRQMSGQTNVRSDKCQVVPMSGQTNVGQDKCWVGQMSGRTNVRSDKCQVRQMSGRTNVRSDKCQVGQMSGQTNVGLHIDMLIYLENICVISLYHKNDLKKFLIILVNTNPLSFGLN
jgi:hypothetical protein